MKIIINPLRDFEAAVILRTLYYATGLGDVEVYITRVNNLISFARYSRVPVYIIKKKVKFEKPEINDNVVILDPNAKKTLDFIPQTLVIDFLEEYKGEKYKVLGTSLLHYEAVAFVYKFFLRKRELKIDVENEIDKDLIYLAKKILEGIKDIDNYPYISPRLLVFALRHIEKKYNVLVDYKNVEIKIDNEKGEIEMKIDIEFFDRKLNKIKGDKIILKGNILEIPVIKKNRAKKYKLFIDYDKQRVYLSKSLYFDRLPEVNIKMFK